MQYWKATHPIPIPPPDVKYGKIPSPAFTHVSTSSSGMKFSLETVEGGPPETTSAGKVYLMPKKLPSLLAADRAKSFATKLGFTNDPQLITPTNYLFTDPGDNLRTLSLDINTMNFLLKYDYQNNSDIFVKGGIISKDDAFNEVKTFIQLNNIFDDSILKGKITYELLSYNTQTKTFFPASSLSDANALRINFFRNDLDGMRILPPQFNESYNHVLFNAGTTPNTRILEMSYSFWPISFDDFGTYPLKSGSAAWKDLTDGYALVVEMGNNSPENIIIRKIYLAYYDSDQPQSYLQPIFVFEGDNGFVAYEPAITSNWLE